MTKDEIIEMARQAGLADIEERGIYMFEDFNIEAFAQLVAAAEREACAKVCEELAELSRTSDTDSMWEWGECAAAIRARGNV